MTNFLYRIRNRRHVASLYGHAFARIRMVGHFAHTRLNMKG